MAVNGGREGEGGGERAGGGGGGPDERWRARTYRQVDAVMI